MLFKLKKNPYALDASSLDYEWIEVMAITPFAMTKINADQSNEAYQIEHVWTCRTDQGIRQIPAGIMEEALALESYVDVGLSQRALKKKRQNLLIGTHKLGNLAFSSTS